MIGRKISRLRRLDYSWQGGVRWLALSELEEDARVSERECTLADWFSEQHCDIVCPMEAGQSVRSKRSVEKESAPCAG